ncbi:MAG: hypothetical protein P4L82_22185 [Ancalomicrobiaceae bacterium]|nr:hypothetical protein [Ancalomicrobiaceae bacterium]
MAEIAKNIVQPVAKALAVLKALAEELEELTIRATFEAEGDEMAEVVSFAVRRVFATATELRQAVRLSVGDSLNGEAVR